MSEAERALVIAVASSPMFRDLPPSQIVPILADVGVYVASEASFYRILRQARMLAHRGRARARRHSRPGEHSADGPNQVWSWDITYLRSPIRGSFYYLYLVVDVWSRKIVGWEVHEMRESRAGRRADPGSGCARGSRSRSGWCCIRTTADAMKGATLLATLDRLGIDSVVQPPKGLG